MELTKRLMNSDFFSDPSVHLEKRLSEAFHFQIAFLAAPNYAEISYTHEIISDTSLF